MGILVALLSATGLSKALATFIAYVVVIAIVVGAVAIGWHRMVATPYIEQGVAKQKALDAPIIAKLTERATRAETDLETAIDANAQLGKDVDALRAQVTIANAATARMSALATQARETAARISAELKARARQDADEISRLKAIADGPAVRDACAAATSIMADLAKWMHA